MKFLSAKKLILIGFIVVLLIAIPLTIFILQQQQQTQTQAEQATTLSFEPESTATNPVQAGLGQKVSLDVIVDPGVNQNLVSFVRLEIQYDPSKLTPIETSAETKPFEENTAALTLLEGPVITDGVISATLSVGVDPTKVIQTRTRIATLNFTATEITGDVPTEVVFSTNSQVLSAGASDQANENVLAGSIPAYIAIAESGEPTAPPSGEPSVTITPVEEEVTITSTPSPTGTSSATPSPTVSDGTGQGTNQAPICEALTSSTTSGVAPFTTTLNVLGSDPDGTVDKATFSFGDGQVQNITEGGGLTTSSVDLPVSHTYTSAGNYQASVVLTDNNGGVSGSDCTIDITVTDSSGSGSGGTNPTATPVFQAELVEVGPGDVLVGAGLIVSIITIVGAALFFLL